MSVCTARRQQSRCNISAACHVVTSTLDSLTRRINHLLTYLLTYQEYNNDKKHRHTDRQTHREITRERDYLMALSVIAAGVSQVISADSQLTDVITSST